MLDPRVAHRGIGGHGYCVDCGSTQPGLCPTKRQEHPRIWARESRRLTSPDPVCNERDVDGVLRVIPPGESEA